MVRVRHWAPAVCMVMMCLWARTAGAENDSAAAQKMEKVQSLLEGRGDAARSTPADAWRAQPEAELTGAGWHALKGLGLCLGVFLIGVYFYKRLGLKAAAGGRRRLRIVERMPLQGRVSLLLVELDGEETLLAVGSDHAALIKGPAGKRVGFEKSLDRACTKENELPA